MGRCLIILKLSISYLSAKVEWVRQKRCGAWERRGAPSSGQDRAAFPLCLGLAVARGRIATSVSMMLAGLAQLLV